MLLTEPSIDDILDRSEREIGWTSDGEAILDERSDEERALAQRMIEAVSDTVEPPEARNPRYMRYPTEQDPAEAARMLVDGVHDPRANSVTERMLTGGHTIPRGSGSKSGKRRTKPFSGAITPTHDDNEAQTHLPSFRIKDLTRGEYEFLVRRPQDTRGALLQAAAAIYHNGADACAERERRKIKGKPRQLIVYGIDGGTRDLLKDAPGTAKRTLLEYAYREGAEFIHAIDGAPALIAA